MSVRTRLLATLSSLALTTVGVSVAAQSAQAQDDTFFGLVTQLAEACLIETDAGYDVVAGDIRVAQCCAVIRRIGPENVDFLQAVALGNQLDPRLIVLDRDLVAVLLSCRQEAIDRLAEIALNVVPGAGPTPNDLYVG